MDRKIYRLSPLLDTDRKFPASFGPFVPPPRGFQLSLRRAVSLSASVLHSLAQCLQRTHAGESGERTVILRSGTVEPRYVR